MKLTNHNARKDKSGLHNDRNFDLMTASHIDQTKISGNKYITYLGSSNSSTFNEVELDFYKQTFSDYINDRNKRNMEHKQKSRIISLEKYYKGKYSSPEDKVIQIGDIDEHIDGDLLWECALEYMDKFNDLYGEHCKILDMALHVDEATPHIHVRRVWMCENDNGDMIVSQTKALDALGFKKPREEEQEGRYNNSKITFTREDRKLFLDICKEHGIEIDKPMEGKNYNLSIKNYKDAKERIKTIYDQDIQRLKKQAEEEQEKVNPLIDKYLEMIQNSAIFNYEDEIEELKKQEYDKKYKFLMEFFENEMNYIEDITAGQMSLMEFAQYNKLNEEYRDILNFLKKKGLSQEYEEYKETKKENQR